MPTILGANTLSSGYDVANSCRFDDGSSDHMHITRGSAGNQRTFTISMWLKRSRIAGGSGDAVYFFAVGPDNNNNFVLVFDNNDQLEVWEYKPSAYNFRLKPKFVFSDPSAWYHLVVAFDTTQATDTNRVKIYVNGSQLTDFDTSSYPSQNYDTFVNSTSQHWLGRYTNQSYYYDGYLAEVVVIDGSALTPTSFGEFDSASPNIWKPIDVSGLTFGTNGFYLDFEDSSALGNDANGGTDLTVANLTSLDQTTDTCTNNFMTLNPLASDSGVTLSMGNTESDFDASVGNAKGNFGLTKGRWYWEVNILNAASYYPMIGIGSMNQSQMQKPTGGSYPGGFTDSYGVYGNSLRQYANGVNEGNQGDNYGTGDIFGIYLDLESSTKTIKWYKNGSEVLSDDIVNAGDDYPYTCLDYNGGEGAVNVAYNFGNPSYSISSGNADDNGYGNFEYSPNISSTKYYAVCTKNIKEFG